MTFHYKTALIIGASRGVGLDLSLKIAEKGVRTISIARNKSGLDSLKNEAPHIETIALNAADDDVAGNLISEFSPDLLVLAGGHQPKMASIADQSWEEFGATWNNDTKIAFEFVKAALNTPLPAGSAIVSFSSGAALNGSPLSGGYAGAKKMQHYVANYGQWDSDRRGLELNFYTIYPKQLIAGSAIANDASAAYGAARNVSAEQFMSQWETPLTTGFIGDKVIDLLTRDGAQTGAYGITGTGMEMLA